MFGTPWPTPSWFSPHFIHIGLVSHFKNIVDCKVIAIVDRKLFDDEKELSSCTCEFGICFPVLENSLVNANRILFEISYYKMVFCKMID